MWYLYHMPECKDIVNQLKAVLPLYTDKFNDSISLTSFIRSGSTITFATSDSTISTGSNILIKGVKMANEATITIVDNIATCTTVNYHDMTEGFQQKAIFTGIAESGWDGSFDVLTVPTQYTFTFEVPTGIDTPTGIFYLLENRTGFNGYKTITNVGSGQYTYELDTADFDLLPSIGNVEYASLVYNTRIAGASTQEYLMKYYEEQKPNKLWAFVVLGNVTASKSRDNDSDATAKIKPTGQEYKQELLLPFEVNVIIPQKAEGISGRILRDEIESEIRPALFKSLLGVAFDTGFISGNEFTTVFVDDGYVNFNSAYYTHRFNFEIPFMITSDLSNPENGDIVKPSESSAFRFFEINYQNDFNETVKKDTGEIV